jgi:uncharacterized membrane protein YsdA (DUF1294 family)
MIETEILNIVSTYGVLGLWTGWLLLQHNRHQKEFKVIVENNTKALAEFKYISTECKNRNA